MGRSSFSDAIARALADALTRWIWSLFSGKKPRRRRRRGTVRLPLLAALFATSACVAYPEEPPEHVRTVAGYLSWCPVEPRCYIAGDDCSAVLLVHGPGCGTWCSGPSGVKARSDGTILGWSPDTGDVAYSPRAGFRREDIPAPGTSGQLRPVTREELLEHVRRCGASQPSGQGCARGQRPS